MEPSSLPRPARKHSTLAVRNMMCELLLAAVFTTAAWCLNSSATFTNPILNVGGADPWVIRHEGWYYMTYTTNVDVTLLRSQHFTCVPLSLYHLCYPSHIEHDECLI